MNDISIYDAVNRIRSELTCDMFVTIREDGVYITIGKEEFLVDESSHQDTANQVNEFFQCAGWLAAMRMETNQ